MNLVYPNNPFELGMAVDKSESYKYIETYKRPDFPIIAFCGRSRCGKDTSCEFLRELVPGLRFGGSISKMIAPFVASALGTDLDTAYNNRHENSIWWYHFCNGLRAEDPTFLVKLTLMENDCVSGIRDKQELVACQDQKVIDYTVWVDNHKVRIDPTLTYGPELADLFLTNYYSLAALRDSISALYTNVIYHGWRANG